MSGLQSLWSTEPWTVITLVLLVFTLGFRRIGVRLLANWLGLTSTTASRLSTAVLITAWAVILIIAIWVRTGG